MKRIRLRALSPSAILVLLSASVIAPLRAQQGPSGTTFSAGATEVTLDARVQTQFNTSSDSSVAPSELRMRRIYLGATAHVNDLVSGKVQADFAGNRVSLKDAYLKLTVSSALQLVAGNAYRPFSRLAAYTSDLRILPIERGLAIRGVSGLEEQGFVSGLGYAERDVGLQVMGAPKGPLGLEYAAGVFAGPLAGSVGAQDSYQYVGRVSVEPIADVSVGAAVSTRDFARPAPGDARPALRRGTAWEADLEIGSFSPGFHLLAEATTGDLDPFADGDFRGAAAWLAYRTHPVTSTVSALEPTLRVSTGDVDASVEPVGGTLLTPGLNAYFGGNNRIMLNLDLWNPAGAAPRQHSFKAMFQVAF
jgi:hypothetical protein